MAEKPFKVAVNDAALTIKGAAIIPDERGRLSGILFLELEGMEEVAPFRIDGVAAESLLNALNGFFKGEGPSMEEIEEEDGPKN